LGFFSKGKLEKASKNKDLAMLTGIMNDSDKEIAIKARLAYIRIGSSTKSLTEKQKRLMGKFETSAVDDIRRAALRVVIGRRDIADAKRVAGFLEGPDYGCLGQSVLDYAYQLAKKDEENKKTILASFQNTKKIAELAFPALNNHPAGDPQVVKALEIIGMFSLWSDKTVVESAKSLLAKTKDNPEIELPEQVFIMIANTQGPEATGALLDYLRHAASDTTRKEQVKSCILKLGDGIVEHLLDEFDAYASRNVSQDQNATAYEDDDYVTSLTTLELIVENAPKGHDRSIKLMGDIVADTKYAKTGRHKKLARKGLDRIRGDIF
jgi:hypothetical protein